jgi:peptidoglycan/LPS O-acetylase OafA/YrhL
MKTDSDAQRFGHQDNAFGFLRLLFASLVIVSHTPEIVDGNRDREILTTIFGTISFGDLAVDAFFIISGYLIASSFLASRTTGSYLVKRVARIYPGFIVAYLFSVLVVPVLAGITADYTAILEAMPRGIVTLLRPEVDGLFAGSHYANLNSPMWTIAYEFRCYLLVIALGALGLLKSPKWLAAGAIMGVLIGYFMPGSLRVFFSQMPLAHELGLAKIHDTARTMGMFLAGGTFFALRGQIDFTWRKFLLAAAALFGCLFVPALASVGVATFGAYLIFATAVMGGKTWLAKVNNGTDISYGVYLYAWPIEKLLVQYFGTQPLILLGLETFMLSALCGWASWHLVEKRCLALAKRQRRDSKSGMTEAVG